MTFDEWWEKNEKQYLEDSLHMSEYHMAKMVWDAANKKRCVCEKPIAAEYIGNGDAFKCRVCGYVVSGFEISQRT